MFQPKHVPRHKFEIIYLYLVKVNEFQITWNALIPTSPKNPVQQHSNTAPTIPSHRQTITHASAEPLNSM